MKYGIILMFALAGLTIGCASPPKTKPKGVIVLRSVATSKSEMTLVVLAKDQSLSVRGQPVTLNDLVQKLESMGVKRANPLFLQAETGTPYAAVAKVVELLQTAGFTNLALVTDNKTSGRTGTLQPKPRMKADSR